MRPKEKHENPAKMTKGKSFVKLSTISLTIRTSRRVALYLTDFTLYRQDTKSLGYSTDEDDVSQLNEIEF